MVSYLEIVFVPAIIAILSAVALLVVRGIAFRLLHAWAERTLSSLDNVIVSSLTVPSLYWCIAFGLYLGVALSSFPDKYIFYVSKAIHIIIVFSITLAAADLAGKLFRDYIQKSNLPLPSTGLAYGIVKGSIIIVGFLLILSILGISIAPLITALGVGGLAVALALQDTLANLFAGIHILVEKSIRVGDLIRLETGQEGYVHDITWRTTRVLMRPNNMVIIPNSKLSQSVVINYHLPEKTMALSIPVGVSFSEDPEKVEKVLLDIVRSGMKEIPGLLSQPAPIVRFIPGFGSSSLDFTLICQVQDYDSQQLVQHELRKKILQRFREEGIEIPFPQRTVYLKETTSHKP